MTDLFRKMKTDTSITAELDIEVNDLCFHLSVKDKEAIIHTDKWKSAISLMNILGLDQKSFSKKLSEIDKELKRIKMTLYIRSRTFPVLGHKAKPLNSFFIKKLLPTFILR